MQRATQAPNPYIEWTYLSWRSQPKVAARIERYESLNARPLGSSPTRSRLIDASGWGTGRASREAVVCPRPSMPMQFSSSRAQFEHRHPHGHYRREAFRGTRVPGPAAMETSSHHQAWFVLSG